MTLFVMSSIVASAAGFTDRNGSLNTENTLSFQPLTRHLFERATWKLLSATFPLPLVMKETSTSPSCSSICWTCPMYLHSRHQPNRWHEYQVGRQENLYLTDSVGLFSNHMLNFLWTPHSPGIGHSSKTFLSLNWLACSVEMPATEWIFIVWEQRINSEV